MVSDQEVPKVCYDIAGRIRGESLIPLKILYVRYDKEENRCMIGFIEQDTYLIVKEIQKKHPEEEITVDQYTSILLYDLNRKIATLALRKLPGDYEEIYIPEECGREDRSCEVKMYYGDEFDRELYFRVPSISLDRAMSVISDFFISGTTWE
ncbi:hypothetical protein BA065_03345 [Nanoarchaeota archaeon NZ13-N]|nr:MAG: hypothetical protein BA065_03345 [Nanoarchaeota archaeon NZ13-N]